MSDLLIDILLPISLAFIMFGMGITLTLNDFTRILKYPKAILIGLSVQLIVLPLVAYLLIIFFNLEAILAIGVMILASCPGGATSNLATQICRGNVALSVTLTAITSFITIFSTQFILSFTLSHFNMELDTSIDLPIWDTTFQIVLITALPIILGMFFKHFFTSFAMKIDSITKTISIVIFALIFAGIIATNFNMLSNALARVGWITLLLNIIIITIGYGGARLLNLDPKNAIAITMEGSIQNATLALFIATTLLDNIEMTLPIASYTIWMYLTSAIFMGFFHLTKKKNIS